MHIAIIPARGGSKGIPNKNIKLFGGIPLLVHSIRHAIQSKLVDRVFVSTDSKQIAEIAEEFGAEIIQRPSNIANDIASSELALIHALDVAKEKNIFPSKVVFLQATSPFRHPKDIDNAITQLQMSGADSLLSVSPNHRFLWRENPDGNAEPVNYDYKNRPRRQDMTPQYVENGSIYIFTPSILKLHKNRLGGNICLYKMEDVSALEIDSELDFRIAELIFEDWAL